MQQQQNEQAVRHTEALQAPATVATATATATTNSRCGLAVAVAASLRQDLHSMGETLGSRVDEMVEGHTSNSEAF